MSAAGAKRGRSSGAGVAEKEFYLDEFRSHTLVLAVDWPLLHGASARGRLRTVIADLLAHGTRVVVAVGQAPVGEDDESGAERASFEEWIGSLSARRATGARKRAPAAKRARPRRRQAPVARVEWDTDAPLASLGQVWRVLRRRPLCLVTSADDALEPGCATAERLRVFKLALLDSDGGLLERERRRSISFLDGAALDMLLSAGEAEFQGLTERRPVLERIDRVLASGVGSVSLCRGAALARELFTYEGAGTLFSQGDYCKIGPLGIDDFEEVESLIQRGQREGLLKPRDLGEIGEILLSGFGAWVGGSHLAGVGALKVEPYKDVRAAEIVALYTITRFKGEGVGGRLVRRLVDEANTRGLDYVFAVTTSQRASRFFAREGFRSVRPERVPSVKWKGYDPTRRRKVRVLRREL